MSAVQVGVDFGVGTLGLRCVSVAVSCGCEIVRSELFWGGISSREWCVICGCRTGQFGWDRWLVRQRGMERVL